MDVIKLTKIYENPMTGTCTHWIKDRNQARVVLDWLESRGLDSTVIRGFREKRGGGFSFRHGVGYNWLSDDLLGGSADGRALREFERETGFSFTFSK